MGAGLNKRIRRDVGAAIHDWQMIQENDRLLLGISGGQDSQVMLAVLTDLKKRAPVKFDLVPVHVDPGFDESFAKPLQAEVAGRFGPLTVEYTDYGIVAHSRQNRENPCFLCARLRRKRLFEMARDAGCNRVVLGHHKDDIIETLFINIFFSGKIATMKPRQSFFGGTLDIIRPLAYVEKQIISAYARKLDLPAFKNPCPSSDRTKRGEVRQMLERLYKGNKHIKGNIFRAMQNVVPEYLLENRHD